jgi:oligogalacturonide lyase
MSKGSVYEDPIFDYEDPCSGRKVVRLTDYLGHSNHFYFTDPCWFNNDRSFVFTSQRENAGNLFRYDLDGHTITQMTDLRSRDRPGGCVSEANQAVYYFVGRRLVELKLDSLEERVVSEVDASYPPGGRASPTADGEYVCSIVSEPAGSTGKRAIPYSYSAFVENFERKPHSQIFKVNIETGDCDVVHEDQRCMGHINTSPKLPDIMTFCHEGPWHRIDQRIWGLNIRTGESWKIREQDSETSVGHEYWFADGETIGYHGFKSGDHEQHLFGYVGWNGQNPTEMNFPFRSTHFQSLDSRLIVGDGTNCFAANARPYIQLFKWDGQQFVGPKILAYHRSTFNDQYAHCHPRLTPDGKYVLYSSDLTSYANIYLVEVGDFEDLPDLTDDYVAPHLRR